MSKQEEEISKIFHKDLSLSQNFLHGKYQDDIRALESENERLTAENQALWVCIKSYQENARLRTANVIAHVLSWSDQQKNNKIQDELSGNQIQNNIPFSNKQHPTSPFRPILTDINKQTPTTLVPNAEQQSSFIQDPPAGASKIPIPQQSPAAPQETSVPGSSMLYNEIIQSRTKSPDGTISVNSREMTVKSPHPESAIPSGKMQITERYRAQLFEQGRKTATPEMNLVSKGEITDVESDWNSMIIRKSPVPQSSPPDHSSTYTISDRRTGKSAIVNIRGNRTGSEGYGSQLANETTEQSDGNQRVGQPIATSTPIASKDGSQRDFQQGSPTKVFGQSETQQQQDLQRNSQAHKSGNTILHRPIDPVIGFYPILSEDKQLKLAQIKPSKRLIGEIAFQLDRRILEFVFSWHTSSKAPKRRRYYGYSIANTGQMIRREAHDVNGECNPNKELEMRYRFDYIIRTLSRFGYSLEKHSAFSQDMVNKYGLLSGPPDQKTVKDFGLEDPVILRVLIGQLIKNVDELENELVLLDCLCVLAYEDRKPIFAW